MAREVQLWHPEAGPKFLAGPQIDDAAFGSGPLSRMLPYIEGAGALSPKVPLLTYIHVYAYIHVYVLTYLLTLIYIQIHTNVYVHIHMYRHQGIM